MEQTFTHDSELKGTLTRLIPSWIDVAKAGRCLGQADGETLKGLGRVHDNKSGNAYCCYVRINGDTVQRLRNSVTTVQDHIVGTINPYQRY
jgi:hypothetical protein